MSPHDSMEVTMDGQRKELPYQHFTLTRRDRRVTVNYAAGDYRILSYMATKEHKTDARHEERR